MFSVHRLLCITIFSFTSAFLFAGGQRETPVSSDSQKVIDAVYLIRDKAMMLDLVNAADQQYIEKYMNQYQSMLDNSIITDSNERLLIESIIRFEMMQILTLDGKKEDAALTQLQQAYDISKNLVEKQRFISSISLRVYADCKMRLIRYMGGLAAIELSNDAKKIYERSIKLNQNEYQSYIGLGTWYLFAPDIAGGDSQTALRALDTAVKSSRSYDKYLAYTWQAFCYTKLLKKDNALSVLSKALLLSPNNEWLLGIQKKLLQNKDIFAGYQ